MISFSSLEDFFDVNFDKREDRCDSLGSPLHVPQDPLHELELWDPSFYNDINIDSCLLSDLNYFDINEKSQTKAKICDRVSQSKVQSKSSFLKKKPRTRKPRRKRTFGGTWSKFGFVNSKPINERKCSHCESKDTPLWRAGPLGKNTLCNACGVRYKSGRLLPEYRPASSPSFDDKKHSNYHKKILKNIGQ